MQQSFASHIQKEVEKSILALQQGRLDEAITGLYKTLQGLKTHVQGYDLVTHNLLVACKMKIQQLLALGDAPGTAPFLNLALGLQPAGKLATDHAFRNAFADCLHGLGIAYSSYYHYEETVLCIRKALRYESSPSYYNELSFALAAVGKPGNLHDYAPAMSTSQLGHHVFIACMPKTGSTFLKNVLTKLTGYKDRFFFYAHGQNEHDLYLPAVLKNSTLNTVTQQHSRASNANVQMMQAFNIKPVVLIRNIFDVVISLLDFYKGAAKINTYHQIDYQNMNDEERIDLLIDFFVPWYFQFYASWSDVESRELLPVTWLSYETMIADKPLAVERILDFYGLKHSPGAIVSSIAAEEADTQKNLFNKGIAGRGKSRLRDAQKERIRSFSRHYPSVDFSVIGI
jgi:tetratricopeptide (TPR) repeat protein